MATKRTGRPRGPQKIKARKPDESIADGLPSREFLEAGWNNARERDPIDTVYSKEKSEAVSVTNLNTIDVKHALEFLYRAFGDPAFEEASLVLASYSLGSGGIRQQSLALIKQAHGGPAWIVMPFMQTWIDSGASVLMAAMKVAAQYGIPGKSFDAVVKLLTQTYALWHDHVKTDTAPDFPTGDTGQKLKVKIAPLPEDGAGNALGEFMGAVFDADGNGIAPDNRQWRLMIQKGHVSLHGVIAKAGKTF